MRLRKYFKRLGSRKGRKRRTSITPHYQTYRPVAQKIISHKVQCWANHIGVTYNRVTIRNQRSRWGSCSSQKNLNFNYRLIFLPEYLLDYVVVHELCHLYELNHSAEFWSLVEHIYPQYKDAMKDLKCFEKNKATNLCYLEQYSAIIGSQ